MQTSAFPGLAAAGTLVLMAGCFPTHLGPHAPRQAPPLTPVLETRGQDMDIVSAPTGDETTRLLKLTTAVISAPSDQQRQDIEAGQKARYQSESNYDNLLSLTMVRAINATSTDDLRQVRTDLQALTNGHDGLSANQRHVALLTLVLVDERLRAGARIVELEHQIDSLTRIEESLSHTDLNGGSEQLP